METKSWWQKLQRNSLARFGATVLIVFYIAVIFADFVAPYNPLAQQPSGSLLPPTQVYWKNPETNQFLGPHVYPTTLGATDIETGERELTVDYSSPTPLRLFVKGDEYNLFELTIPLIKRFSFDGEIELSEWKLFNGIPSNRHLFGPVGDNAAEPLEIEETEGEGESIFRSGETAEESDTAAEDSIAEPVEEPAAAVPVYFNLLGTDNAARDVFSRLVFGGRISLSIGLIGIMISFPLGLLVGGISGYFGGVVDSVLMRIVEVIMTIPSIYLLVALGVILPPELDSSQRFLLIILIISFIGWAGLARVIRGEVLSLKERTFVQASQSMGGRSLHIITRHVLPQTATYVITSATLAIPGYIISEAVLSLIGLGIQEPDPSWGNMLSAGTNASVLVLNPWLVWPPAALIVITVLSFNLLGDGLRDVLDPRSLSE